ncbi:lysylphosphatidylglycerol synthase transmembrane domain-containing protein [Bradymonas sediminis]|uniref:UPF0104 family protein n=1 Tax=Bradymonas sediminis TaxID=1548548 RepID=A0A2Z4FP60_9DELT|nr:lysylphosphatidylglycerol synthase transmembrane domain-containing protein [Bradymonas sediminis]AWV90444.1 UPF0104 family protein [Bradymonas sediminis]TDP72169.1 uncharacterized protein (TIRG00374 family) [Bradymonas sediminis]
MGKLEKRILWGVIFGALVYAAIALFTDAKGLLASLASFPVSVVLAALGLSVLNYALRFAKWQLYLKKLNFAVPLGASLNIFIAGMAMSVTPGKIGEVLKSMLLKERYDLPVARSAPIVFAERITDLLGLFVIAGVGIATFDFGRVAFGAALVLVGLLIVVLNRPSIVHKLLNLWEKLPLVGHLRGPLEQSYEAARELLSWRLLSGTTVLSVLGWSMEAFAFYLILHALGAEHATLQSASFIFAMTTILGAISFLPGGLGVAEASMIGVLMLMGIFGDESSATAATYLIRFTTLWFGVLLGLGALGWFRLGGGGLTPAESST